jgi:hypothetical protein
MLLCEFDIPDPLLVKLVAITSQLKKEIDQGKQKSDWTVNELLSLYKANGIIIDKTDFYNMIKSPPLDKSISNIQGNAVKFKGQDAAQSTDVDNNQKIVKQMAQSALK